MPFHTTYKHIYRGGEHYRCHDERFFYIKQHGWFVRTRAELEMSDGMELSDGIVGPFMTLARARYFLMKLIFEENPGAVDWRRHTS